MKNRADAMRSIAGQHFDLCVIGGGATGAGCALDAQLRGLRTVVLEASDFASGASGASTKIVHGGVRYLQQAITHLDVRQYRVVKRALHERAFMLANAPFLTRTLEFVIPCRSWRELAYYGLGMKIYDIIARSSVLTPSRNASSDEVKRRLPPLKENGIVGAIVYSDGQFNDCRYNMALVNSFTEVGGEALNYARVVGFEKDSTGNLIAVEVRDQLEQEPFVVRATAFVNATGAASDSVREMAHAGIAPRMHPSKGVHIFLPLRDFSEDAALLIPSTEDGRVIFAIPWRGVLLIGTTDDAAQDTEELIVTQAEADYLLRHLNQHLKNSFSRNDILSGSAGLRPLVSGKGETGELVRDHEVELDEKSGLISILGGKWTTYRAMAEETIDAVQRYLMLPITPCQTARFGLSGGKDYSPNLVSKLMDQYRISTETADHLVKTFGTNAKQVLGLTKTTPDLLSLISDNFPAIQAEVVYCVRQEMAMSIEDILARRTGLQLLSAESSIKAAPVVGRLLARELNWSASQEEKAISSYVGKIRKLIRTVAAED
jgi:glycerol-3-phosphate dehydrogenase